MRPCVCELVAMSIQVDRLTNGWWSRFYIVHFDLPRLTFTNRFQLPHEICAIAKVNGCHEIAVFALNVCRLPFLYYVYTHPKSANPSENAFISIVPRLSAHASYCAMPTNRQQKYARSEKYNSALSRITFFHSLKWPAAATCDRSAHRWLQTRLLLSWNYFNFSSLRLCFCDRSSRLNECA